MSPLVQVRHKDLSIAVDVSAGHGHHLRRGLHEAEGRRARITFLQPQTHWNIVALPYSTMCGGTLLDFAVILQLLTVKKYSKIPYIRFTVNYCNTHCIMGISVLILQ